MTADYAKKKNAELEELLKARNLPHTGKKAELVARLLASDEAGGPDPTLATDSTPAAAPTTEAAPAEDEIDWDESAPAASSGPGAAALAAGGTGQIANPTAVPNQIATNEPASAAGTTIVQPTGAEDPEAKQAAEAAGAEVITQSESDAQPPAASIETEAPAAAPKKDFTAGIAETTVEEELEKRRKRAEKFGLQAGAEGVDEEAQKALERAKKFGTGAVEGETRVVKGLDAALPEREKKRGREHQGGRDEKRRDSRRRDRGGRGGGDGGDGRVKGGRGGSPFRRRGSPFNKRGGRGGGGGGGTRPNAEQADKDRIAAEKRKAKFGTA